MATINKGKGMFGATLGGDECQNYSLSKTITEYTCQDADGNTVGIALRDIVTETTVSVLVETGTEMPEPGDSYNGGYVTSVTHTASNTSFQIYEITTKAWDSVE